MANADGSLNVDPGFRIITVCTWVLYNWMVDVCGRTGKENPDQTETEVRGIIWKFAAARAIITSS
jgi:hypothetical protein